MGPLHPAETKQRHRVGAAAHWAHDRLPNDFYINASEAGYRGYRRYFKYKAVLGKASFRKTRLNKTCGS
jgi:hypothetical protein